MLERAPSPTLNKGENVSHYCKEHPKYEAKREPSGLCGKCWALYFYKNPESKEGLMRVYREAKDLLTDAEGCG